MNTLVEQPASSIEQPSPVSISDFRAAIARAHTVGELMSVFNAQWAALVGTRSELDAAGQLWCAKREQLMEDRAAA